MSWQKEAHEKLVEMEERLERLEMLIDKIWRRLAGYGLNEEPFKDEEPS